MAWKATGHPTVRQQRGRWVVRVDGVDLATGKRQPRLLGTYPSQRSARAAASEATARGDEPAARGTLGELVDAWVASRIDVSEAQQEQYRWAAGHITAGLGGIKVEHLDRAAIADWLGRLADGGKLGRRSIQIVRMTLRAALAAAVEAGELPRNPAATVPMPRQVKRAPRAKDADAWDQAQLERFLAVLEDHRWGGAIELEVLYGLRRSELLGLHWVDIDLKRGTVTVQAGLVDVRGRNVWTEGKNARSRRTITVDDGTRKALRRHRQTQLAERALAGERWEDNDLVVATQLGREVNPRNYNQTLERLVQQAGVPRLTSHGLRHTAAIHMVAGAADLGEVRAAADTLGHSPEMLMKTCSHVLPASLKAVTAKIGQRRPSALATPPKRTGPLGDHG